MTRVITTGNFKGGVGKTTNAVMFSYTLSKMNLKTLLIDFDPQANATDLLLTTKKNVFHKSVHFQESLFDAIKQEDLNRSLIPIKDNLSLLPSFDTLQEYEDFLSANFDDDYTKDHYFDKLLQPVKNAYDFVIIDVPPQLNKFTDSALVASDYVVIILQTQERSLKGAEKYVQHLLQIHDDYNLNVELLGVLPVLQQNGSELDLDVINDAIKSFSNDNLFDTKIKQMARLKRFDRTGITDNPRDINDVKVHLIYQQAVDELIDRIQIMEK